MLELIQSAVTAIPDDSGVDALLASDNSLLSASADTKTEPMDMDACDIADTMMCKIVDDMTWCEWHVSTMQDNVQNTELFGIL